MAGTTVDCKPQGILAFLSPERFHDSDPSPASDMWSFMVVFVYLYLGRLPFSNLHGIVDDLGPLPAEWAKPKPKYDTSWYESAENSSVPKCIFATWLRENWQKEVAATARRYSGWVEDGNKQYAERANRAAQEAIVKEQAETHVLKVIRSVFRHQPEERLTASQLLEDPGWKKLMELCGVH
jgi:serine/threonine protein kinase